MPHRDHLDALVELLKDKNIEEIRETLKAVIPGTRAVHDEGDRLFCIRYELLKIDFNQMGALATRGTIFELDDQGIFRGKVVCLPFYKFFNATEPHGKRTPFDWESAYAITKADGCLIKVFHYAGEWNVASNNTYKADEKLVALFQEAAPNSGFSYDRLDTNRTYVFEMVSPDHRIVVKYAETKLFHLMTRCCTTLREIECDDIGVERPPRLDVTELDLVKVQSVANCFEAVDNEGFVVVDKNGQRLKIKGEAYVLAHNSHTAFAPVDRVPDLNDMLLAERIMAVVLNDSVDDLLSIRPSFEILVNNLYGAIARAQENLNSEQVWAKTFVSRKELAAAIKKSSKPINAIEWILFKYYGSQERPDIKTIWSQNHNCKRALSKYILAFHNNQPQASCAA